MSNQEPSLGELRTGSYIHSNNPDADQMRRKFASLIDEVHCINATTMDTGEQGREMERKKSLAMTSIETAHFYALRALYIAQGKGK